MPEDSGSVEESRDKVRLRTVLLEPQLDEHIRGAN